MPVMATDSKEAFKIYYIVRDWSWRWVCVIVKCRLVRCAWRSVLLIPSAVEQCTSLWRRSRLAT